MRRRVLGFVALAALLFATTVQADWVMQIRRGPNVTETPVSGVDEITYVERIVPMMVRVSAGTFTMGDGAAPCGVDERTVTLTRDFLLGQHEVTNQEYLESLQWALDNGYVIADPDSVRDNLDGSQVTLLRMANPYCEIQFDLGMGKFYLRESPSAEAQSTYPGGYDPAVHPVKKVTWYGAVAFCDWLSMRMALPRAYQHTGNWSCNGGDPYGAPGFRLPTDAEWEYAAQWNDERTYPWGNQPPNCGRANFAPDEVTMCVGWSTRVGNYPPAPMAPGLWDMAGNMAEMCNDVFTCNLGTLPYVDPAGPPTGTERVLRGGFWMAVCDTCDWGVDGLRSAARGALNLELDDNDGDIGNGFRAARTFAP